MHRSFTIAAALAFLVMGVFPQASASDPVATPPVPDLTPEAALPSICEVSPALCFSIPCLGCALPPICYDCGDTPIEQLCRVWTGPCPTNAPACTVNDVAGCASAYCTWATGRWCAINDPCDSLSTGCPPACHPEQTFDSCVESQCEWARITGCDAAPCDDQGINLCEGPSCQVDSAEACAEAICSWATGFWCDITVCESLSMGCPPMCSFQETFESCVNRICNWSRFCDVTLPCSTVASCAQFVCTVVVNGCNTPTIPCSLTGTIDQCVDNVCNTFSPSPCVTGPIGGVLPGNGAGEETPGEVHVDPIVIVSPITVPGVPGIDVYVPPFETRSVTVPYTCTPFGVLCVGPATIPGQSVGGETIHVTDPIPPTPVTGPTPLPPATTVPLPATAALSVSHGDIVYSVDANLGETSSIGPITTEVPGPFGPIPVGLCVNGCPVPVAPGASVTTSITVTVRVGGETVSHTVPITATTV